MAKLCDKCQRPNRDLAPRCLYCGNPFPEPAPGNVARAQPESAARPEPAAPSRARAEVYLAVISPEQKLAGPGLERLAALISLDPYICRHKLKHPAPWVARTSVDPDSAAALVKALAEIGLDAYVVKQSGIEKLADRIQVVGLAALEPDRVVFLDREGEPMPLDFKDLFLIVRGRIKVRPEREDQDNPTAVRMGKMIGSGQPTGEKSRLREALEKVQVRPRLAFLRWVLSPNAVEIMDLYRRSSPRPLRMVESEFDYSGLNDQMTPSGLINFNAILSTIREGCPGCPVDSSFNFFGHAMEESPRVDKVRLELETLLGASEGMKKTFDNQAFFDDHSARLYLHHLRRSQSRRAPGQTD